MFPQGHVGLTTSLLKTFKLFGFLRIVTAIGDGVNEVIRQHEGDSLPVNPELLLVVAQEVAEVDVEELTVPPHHYVVVVTVAHALQGVDLVESRHTGASG